MFSPQHTKVSNVAFPPLPMGVMSSSSYGHWQIAARSIHMIPDRWLHDRLIDPIDRRMGKMYNSFSHWQMTARSELGAQRRADRRTWLDQRWEIPRRAKPGKEHGGYASLGENPVMEAQRSTNTDTASPKGSLELAGNHWGWLSSWRPASGGLAELLNRHVSNRHQTVIIIIVIKSSSLHTHYKIKIKS